MTDRKLPHRFFELPWFLWLVGVPTCALILFNLNAQFISRAQDRIDPLAAILLLYILIASFHMFVRHRNAWMVMIFCWLAVLAVTIFEDLTVSEPLSIAKISEVPMLAGCIGFAIFYFKHPYINVRSNLIGPADRFYLKMDALFEIGSEKFPCEVTCLSVTGFAIRRGVIRDSAGLSHAWLMIDSMNAFRTKVRIVAQTPDAMMLEIQGFTVSSIFEHLKIRKYVSRLKRVTG